MLDAWWDKIVTTFMKELEKESGKDAIFRPSSIPVGKIYDFMMKKRLV